MNWLILLLIKTFLVVLVILYKKLYSTNNLIFPVLTSIIVGIYSLIYFLMFKQYKYFKEINIIHILIYSATIFFLILISFIILKLCPNPAIVRAFVGLEIVLLLLYGILYNKFEIEKYDIVGCIFIILGILIISFKYIKKNKKIY
jgi:drug/metabolite transporter (DMT)-like permease